VNHEHHFTLDEANALLERVEPMLLKLREARDKLTDAEAHELLSDAAPTNGGGEHGRTIGDGFMAVRRLLNELAQLGIVVRDIDRGLIDFPSLRDGREIYLCWELGEGPIEFWHELDAGFGGREPLD
jgi:hypothetical protein